MPEILGLTASVELCRLGAEAVLWRKGAVATRMEEALGRSDRAQLRAAYLHGTDMIREAVRGVC